MKINNAAFTNGAFFVLGMYSEQIFIFFQRIFYDL